MILLFAERIFELAIIFQLLVAHTVGNITTGKPVLA